MKVDFAFFPLLGLDMTISFVIYLCFLCHEKKLLFSCKKNIVFLEQKIFSGLFFTHIFSLYLSCWNHHACFEILVFFESTCRLFLLRSILKNSLKLYWRCVIQYFIWKLLIVVETYLADKGLIALLHSTIFYWKVPVLLLLEACGSNIFLSDCTMKYNQ